MPCDTSICINLEDQTDGHRVKFVSVSTTIPERLGQVPQGPFCTFSYSEQIMSYDVLFFLIFQKQVYQYKYQIIERK